MVSIDFQQRCQGNSLGKEGLLKWWWHNWISIYAKTHTYVHTQRHTFRPLPHMIHKNEFKNDLKTET